jgi:hypothetical protein
MNSSKLANIRYFFAKGQFPRFPQKDCEMEAILNFEQDLDIQTFDKVVSTFFRSGAEVNRYC